MRTSKIYRVKYAHPRATSNTARIHQLSAILHTGSFLEGVGEEEDVREDEEDAEDHINYCNCSFVRASIDCIYCSTASLGPCAVLAV